jgi:hypothetical protein
MAPEASSIVRPAIEDNAETMARHHIDKIGVLKIEAGKLKEMLSGIMTSDPTYQAHDAAYKEALRVRNNTKKQIMKLPTAADLSNKIADLRQQINENGQQLSLFLEDFQRETGSNQIEDSFGKIHKIVRVLRADKG